ncbi:MAG: YbaB/EbfC family nucleoid-associated protein [Thermocrispum sp.]
MSRADDMDRQIDEFAVQYQAKVDKYRVLTSEMESVTGDAESASGVVRVTVNRGGILTGLQITDDIRTMRGSQLAGEIMAAVRCAQAGLGPQVVAVMQELVPEDRDGIAKVADSYARQFPPAKDETRDDDEGNTSVFE